MCVGTGEGRLVAPKRPERDQQRRFSAVPPGMGPGRIGPDPTRHLDFFFF